MDDKEHGKTPHEALHNLMEAIGNQVDVLSDLRIIADALEGRHLKLAKGLVAMVIVATAFNVIALVWSESNISKVRTAQQEIKRTAAEGRAFARSNRDLIVDLERVAVEAQANGARASRELCKEINKVKDPIRRLLGLSERGKRFQVLFKKKDCTRLPNSKPATP